MSKNILLTIGVVLALVISIAAFVLGGGSSAVSFGNTSGTSTSQAIFKAAGFYTTGLLWGAGPVNLSGSTNLASTTVNGLFTSSPVAVSTTTTGGTAQTILELSLLSSQYWSVNVNEAADYTYTLPATSTLTTLLSNAGEKAEWCFNNATTTAGIDLFFVTGTGIDLETATGTSVLEAVGPGDSACLTLQRKVNTDFFGRLDIYDDSD